MTSLELGLQFMLYVVGKEGASHVLLGKVKRRRVVLRFDENGRVFSLAKARRKFVTSPHLTSPHLTSPIVGKSTEDTGSSCFIQRTRFNLSQLTRTVKTGASPQGAGDGWLQ